MKITKSHWHNVLKFLGLSNYTAGPSNIRSLFGRFRIGKGFILHWFSGHLFRQAHTGAARFRCFVCCYFLFLSQFGEPWLYVVLMPDLFEEWRIAGHTLLQLIGTRGNWYHSSLGIRHDMGLRIIRRCQFVPSFISFWLGRCHYFWCPCPSSCCLSSFWASHAHCVVLRLCSKGGERKLKCESILSGFLGWK